jgi:hypothetical protein
VFLRGADEAALLDRGSRPGNDEPGERRTEKCASFAARHEENSLTRYGFGLSQHFDLMLFGAAAS